MDLEFIFRMFELGAGILRNHAKGKTAEVVDGLTELESLLKAGADNVRSQAGLPVDENLA